VGFGTGLLGGCTGGFCVCMGGVLCYASVVGLFFGDGGAFIVAIISAYVIFVGVFLVAYSATYRSMIACSVSRGSSIGSCQIYFPFPHTSLPFTVWCGIGA
jgi:uncharacterized membrane protein YedE/YeeE